jgi:SAM-dependent methyltransferase
VFVDPGGSAGGILPQEMEALLADAEALGWKEALERRLPEEEATSPARADWRFLVPLTEASRVLDVRAGWGTLTAVLAPEVDVIVAADECLGRARFLEIRSRQSGLHNVMPIVARPPRIPFPDGTFDLVILDHVLDREEALPVAKTPREAQLLLLRTIRRKLAPGGHLYMGVENRFGLPHLFGGDRDSAGRRTREGRACACGLDGYRRLVREAGFVAADFYAPTRTPARSNKLLPLEDATIFDFWAPRSLERLAESPLKLRLTRAAFRAGLLPRLVPRFCILVRKGGAQ